MNFKSRRIILMNVYNNLDVISQNFTLLLNFSEIVKKEEEDLSQFSHKTKIFDLHQKCTF
jgi:hypothetical protein